MKSNTKILIGFLSVIILVLIQIGITYKLQSDFYDNLLQIKDVEGPLEILVEQVIGYDAILTGNVHAALIHALNGEYTEVKAHKERYDEIGVKLDELLKRDARILLLRSKRSQEAKDKVEGYLRELDRFNTFLVDLETRAFEAIEEKDTEIAYSLVVGGDYDNYKEELYKNYLAWADIEHEITLNVQKNILKDSQKIIYFNLGISMGIMIMIILTLLVIRSFVAGKYKLLYETSKDAIMTLEPPKWNFTSGNSAALKMFNLKDERQFVSLTPEELSPEKQPDGQFSNVKSRKMINKAMKEGSAFFEWTHKKYKGKNFPATVLLSKVKENRKIYLQATVRDLTKSAEKKKSK